VTRRRSPWRYNHRLLLLLDEFENAGIAGSPHDLDPVFCFGLSTGCARCGSSADPRGSRIFRIKSHRYLARGSTPLSCPPSSTPGPESLVARVNQNRRRQGDGGEQAGTRAVAGVRMEPRMSERHRLGSSSTELRMSGRRRPEHVLTPTEHAQATQSAASRWIDPRALLRQPVSTASTTANGHRPGVVTATRMIRRTS
jgi:hypothetical protein